MTDPVRDFRRGGGDGPDYSDPVGRLKLKINDRDNALRLHGALREDMVFVPGKGWGCWNGRFFDFEAGDEEALSRAGRLEALINEETAALDTQPLSKERVQEHAQSKAMSIEAAEKEIRAERKRGRAAAAAKCANISRMRAAVELAKPHFRRSIEALDSDREIIQVQNGTLDLRRLTETVEAEDEEERSERWHSALREPEKASLPTRVCGVAFDPSAEAPEFQRFVRLIMPDDAERAYLRRCCGLLLGGQINETALFFIGQGGNGKSTLVNALEGVLGGYAQPCRIDLFIESRTANLGVTPEEAVLPGARAYMASEPEMNVTLSAAKIKGLTGGNRRQANPKNKDVFSYMPVGIPILQLNRMPAVTDASDGFWRRIFPVMFGVSLSDLPRDQQRSSAEVAAMLRDELAGILNWMIEGYVDARDIGLSPPASVSEFKTAQRALADPVGEFLDEYVTVQTGSRTRTAHLHKAFVAWCERQGNKAMSGKAFMAAMFARGFKRIKDNHHYWVGLDMSDAGFQLAGVTDE